ncbi:MAG TPA: ABC transporter permease [Cellvibrionaceae bacterium]
MIAFIASLNKELRLLLRDWHALLLLFLMPAIFIVIMSLALAERFGGNEQFQLKGYLVQQTNTPAASSFVQSLSQTSLFDLTEGHAEAELNLADKSYALIIAANFDQALDTPNARGVHLRFAPELGAREQELISAAVHQAFASFYTRRIADELGYDDDYAREELMREGFIGRVDADLSATPTAVQQNVSGWLIFAMFFIAIPLSTTVIQERSQRTLMRLQTLGASLGVIYLAKLAPYGLINLLQLLLMLLLGAFLLPLLGARGLSLAVNLPALLVMGICTSVAALTLASLIATLARTVEQATVVSGGLNILLAALGGIMIPAFIMPPAMQTISQLSPMSWALAGFLEVLVRGGGITDIAAHCFRLLLLSLILATLAAVILKRSNPRG